MPIEPDPVPRPVEEGGAVARGIDDGPCRCVHRLAGDARANRSCGRSLRLEEDREHVREVAVGVFRIVAPGHPEGPRDVRAVAAQRPADVEHDRLARLDDPLGRLVMRRRRVRARGDDREHRRLVTFVDQPLADLPRDVSLGPPDERPAGDGRDDPIRGVGGRAKQRDLIVVLAHAEIPKHGRRWDVRGPIPERCLDPE